MASNAELIEQIKKFNPDFEQGEHTNVSMSALLKDLKAESEPEPKPEPKPKAKGYVVAKGKSLTTRAGMKSEGQAVTADMVTGGEEKLQLLKAKGFIA